MRWLFVFTFPQGIFLSGGQPRKWEFGHYSTLVSSGQRFTILMEAYCILLLGTWWNLTILFLWEVSKYLHWLIHYGVKSVIRVLSRGPRWSEWRGDHQQEYCHVLVTQGQNFCSAKTLEWFFSALLLPWHRAVFLSPFPVKAALKNGSDINQLQHSKN